MASLGLHVPGNDWSLTAWHVDPELAASLAVAAAAYAVACRAASAHGRRVPPAWRIAAYYSGLAVLAFALLGPLDHLNDELLVAHMAQHLLLSLVAPPLVLLGRPAQVFLIGMPASVARLVVRSTVKRPIPRTFFAALAHPVALFLAYNVTLTIWHLPWLYQAAVTSEPLHVLEHSSFLATSFLFWWVIVDPYPRTLRLSTSAAAILLFATWMAGDLLGATLTLSQEVIYPIYGESSTAWGLTPIDDQRAGGLLMWAGAGVLFAALLIARLASSVSELAPSVEADRAAIATDGRHHD